MSDGCKVGSKRENENGIGASERATAVQFGRAVAKIAVAQICESVGFESFHESALEALSDIALQYLRDLGKTANFYANLAGRTDCSVFDVLQGLEDINSLKPSLVASEASHCLAGSGTVREIVEYMESAEEIPIAQPVPHFPVIRDRRMTPSFMQMGEMPAFKHIPAWLPAFPDPHAYVHTPMWNERMTDPRADKVELARQQRKAERSLLSLQQRLVWNGLAVPSTLADVGNDGKALQVAETKIPFLTENHFSVVEAFAPAIEAVKGFHDAGDSDKRVLPDKIPSVHLKFKTGKKIIGASLDLSLQYKGSGRTACWIGRDDERDDKKRRAEFILRQSMENPQELTQL
ncbi:transcription initiation factor TFIID subunit 8-like [Cornus florida]|uniref:transcription initiation factor TFIID subunit 8-like n=1 Tax=Cornus florida TaxID=4283 RepID=UPI00289E523E|nr:transcription initiation factor TFIID subunit 8-like [Cornus florida]XP_059646845.1 transcription initiation factor TFIID subunit 8-like [Cornus florida]XP_059646846.1 transcription initiation factor TFIID subunit 8-like [Cornus florida]XP_059646847.1 transcription initiation factor TFIID subunit 8-like [Cornus florida]XP_059646849.1 transcription initiation factor TFIID subunit 8-like [Cornus florida]